ncbi:MAG: hypothetical protein IT369_09920 [Candidatus Latescibacteria bacterium]|nr:hypothetical protein [Candidatus Latescibacterota bacterium]
MNPGVLLGLLVVALCGAGPADPAAALTGDFNQDQRLDQQDLALLRAALGSADPLCDLNGDGRVDLEDFFRWADLLQPRSIPPAYYALTTTRQTTTVRLTGYTITIHHTNPFGISSLRLIGQPVDFVHPTLPLGDWEWFWFSDPIQNQAKVKLLEQAWPAPEVARSDTGVVLRFRRKDVLRRGVEVEVAYHLDARRPEFTAEYTIHNHSEQFLLSPYMMVGFPGFANQQWVEEVSTAEKARRPTPPYADFLAEAQARNLTDYLLLRQDWNPLTQPPEVLQGSVSLQAADRIYTLTTTLAAASGLRGAYIAHTNKPRYLTSHLYAFLNSIGEGQSQRIAVHYVLSRSN